ncbi:MAG: terminase large subunit domain-containing protein [Desulfobaccales bacterium]
MIDIITAIRDENLFGPLFRDLGTWRAWRVFLKALFGLRMGKAEFPLYRQCTGRDVPPDRPSREAWVVAGRRSGKSFIAALVAVYVACFRDYRPHLAPGEQGHVLVVAADRGQAQVVFRYVKGFLAANPMLARMVEAERAEAVDLTNRVTVGVATCSYRAIRGFTLAAAICDEVAFWRSDDGANPATEVLRALRPALATIPGSLLLCVSSPYARSGPLWESFKTHWGCQKTDVLVWQAATRVMNPTIAQDLIDRDMAADPEAARSEWEAEFRSDLASFLDPEVIEAVMIPGRYELPPRGGVEYTAFVDPSGGRGDAAALALAHTEGERVVLDLARRWPAPHDPAQVVEEMAEVLKAYGVRRVTGDRYAGEWPRQEFQKHGVTYEAAAKDKSALYLEFLPLVLSGRCELLDLRQLFSELRNLVRRTRSGGRDMVDHPPKGNDDLANAVAGACTLAGAGVIRPKPRLRWIGGLSPWQEVDLNTLFW